jgi:hypothetical protein
MSIKDYDKMGLMDKIKFKQKIKNNQLNYIIVNNRGCIIDLLIDNVIYINVNSHII